MNHINILYIDDDIQSQLSRFLDVHLYKILADDMKQNGYTLLSRDLSYNNLAYEEVLNDDRLKSSDILIIDSALFDNADAGDKITGELLRMVIKKTFPYKQCIIISQNDSIVDNNIGILKYRRFPYDDDNKFIDYYKKILLPQLKESISETLFYKQMIGKLDVTKSIDSKTVDDMKALLVGDIEFSELKKEDINLVISKFKELIGGSLDE